MVSLFLGFLTQPKSLTKAGPLPKSGPAASGPKTTPFFHHRPKAPLHKAFSYTSKNRPDSSEDIAKKRITTRDNATKIADYSHKLRKSKGMSGDRITKYSITGPNKSTSSKTKSKSTKPRKPTKIAWSQELQAALEDIPSYKLERLYHSLCSLSLSTHTPLLSVGAWSFMETLTALSGRNSSTSFHSYLSSQKLQKLGLSQKMDRKSVQQAVKRVSEFGNSTKHNPTSAAFNGEQLANDIETMGKMLIALAEQSKGKS